MEEEESPDRVNLPVSTEHSFCFPVSANEMQTALALKELSETK